MSDIEGKATRVGASERGQRTSFNYFPDTDSLYIDLSHKQSTESQEVSEGVVLDYDAEGNLVGIEHRPRQSKAELARARHESHSAGSESSELNRRPRLRDKLITDHESLLTLPSPRPVSQLRKRSVAA